MVLSVGHGRMENLGFLFSFMLFLFVSSSVGDGFGFMYNHESTKDSRVSEV